MWGRAPRLVRTIEGQQRTAGATEHRVCERSQVPACACPELEPPAERPSAVARVSTAAPRAARVQAAEGARVAGRSAWTRASTVPPLPDDGGATTRSVGPVQSALTGICRDG